MILQKDKEGSCQLTKKGRDFWDLNVNKYDY
jgi:hypothetical protein